MSDPKPPRYQVTGAMVVAKTHTSEGVKLLNFYKHAILPPDVPEKQISLFLRRRLVVRVDENGTPVPEPESEPAAQAAPVKAGRAKTAAGG